MPALNRFRLAALLEFLSHVLTDRFEQPVPYSALSGRFDHEQGFVHKFREKIH